MTTTKTTTTSKATVDSKGQPLYLRVTETREGGYFHLRATVCVQHYEAGGATSGGSWVPWGCDDDYSDGLKWSGLRVSCQGDERSQRRAAEAGENGPVYGFDTEYHDVWRLDLRTVRRMEKTLARVEKKLAALQEARGYVRSYGEYLGRVAEALGCAGVCFERERQAYSGSRWDWLSIGDGVNRANHRIFLWQQEAVERDAREALPAASCRAGEEVLS